MATTAQIEAFNKMNGTKAKSIEDMVIIVINQQPILGATKNEICRILNMPHQTITSRLSALQDKGRIYHENGIRNHCTIFHVSPSTEIEKYANRRKFEKFKAWTKRGQKEFGLTDSQVNQLTCTVQTIKYSLTLWNN